MRNSRRLGRHRVIDGVVRLCRKGSMENLEQLPHGVVYHVEAVWPGLDAAD